MKISYMPLKWDSGRDADMNKLDEIMGEMNKRALGIKYMNNKR